MEFNVCPQKHPLPWWWNGPCLKCDYSVGIEILRERVRKGGVYGYVVEPKDEKAKV
jgi:hypothetical protein